MLRLSLTAPKPMYLVTRKFTGGTLAGITYTEVSSVYFEVGLEIRKTLGGSPYIITQVVAL